VRFNVPDENRLFLLIAGGVVVGWALAFVVMGVVLR
jgi:hypothetical protein